MQRTTATAAVAFFALALNTAAANQGTQNQPSGATAPRAAGERSDQRGFIDKMAIAGLTEVQLGKVAAERGRDSEVEAFGQMMVEDHTQANAELEQVASQAGIELPAQLDEQHRQLIERLTKLEGAEFDREYMKAMVEGHEDVADSLRRQIVGAETSPRTGPGAAPVPTGTTGAGTPGAATGSTPDSGSVGATNQSVRQWAMKTLPVVQWHLQRAREIRARVEERR